MVGLIIEVVRGPVEIPVSWFSGNWHRDTPHIEMTGTPVLLH